MILESNQKIEEIYKTCYSVLGPDAWSNMLNIFGKTVNPETLVDKLTKLRESNSIPYFLPDLARLEWIRHTVMNRKLLIPKNIKRIDVNPTLNVLKLSWKLVSVLKSENDQIPVSPKSGEEWAMIWRDPKTNEIKVEAATEEELLALKIVVEEMTDENVIKSGKITSERIDAIVNRAVDKGLLIAPSSRIRRDDNFFYIEPDLPEKFLVSSHFTLQWHITNACDLNCAHCYDRTKRSPMKLTQGMRILDDLYTFCKDRYVSGHVCFTGGNPFLYPHFLDLYKAASEHGFTTSVLGNPVPREKIVDLIKIQMPNYFQVSLEGLPEHNDSIRGAGNFISVIEFLGVLCDLQVSSAVMLTLTKDNIEQVIPLAERLRGHTDHFTFNRLSKVGRGAKLQLPTPEEYATFLQAYVDAAQKNPIIGFKDNLINIVCQQREIGLFDGCTGFGCGAAFNFIAVLPNGDTHACRKFPSFLGNILEKDISDIYDSKIAKRYRIGTSSCRMCRLRPICGGCLAITCGHKLDIFQDRDPYCFFDQGENLTN